MAYGAWRLQIPESAYASDFPVWAWGGGVSFAQLTLAKLKDEAASTLITSSALRAEVAIEAGLEAVDRSAFSDLSFDGRRCRTDEGYAKRHRDAEKRFLSEVHDRTNGEGVAIFIDNIETPVARATLKALARQGVVTTGGWKAGMQLSVLRASECIARHTHVHTHFATPQEVADAVAFAAERNWVPSKKALGKVWSWDEIPELASAYACGGLRTYFPIFQVNGG